MSDPTATGTIQASQNDAQTTKAEKMTGMLRGINNDKGKNEKGTLDFKPL